MRVGRERHLHNAWVSDSVFSLRLMTVRSDDHRVANARGTSVLWLRLLGGHECHVLTALDNCRLYFHRKTSAGDFQLFVYRRRRPKRGMFRAVVLSRLSLGARAVGPTWICWVVYVRPLRRLKAGNALISP